MDTKEMGAKQMGTVKYEVRLEDGTLVDVRKTASRPYTHVIAVQGHSGNWWANSWHGSLELAQARWDRGWSNAPQGERPCIGEDAGCYAHYAAIIATTDMEVQR